MQHHEYNLNTFSEDITHEDIFLYVATLVSLGAFTYQCDKLFFNFIGLEATVTQSS